MGLLDKIVLAATRSRTGGFVDTDGEWCSMQTPDQFKSYLEENGLHVTMCVETSYSTAVAEVKEGYRVAWSGHCRKL